MKYLRILLAFLMMLLPMTSAFGADPIASGNGILTFQYLDGSSAVYSTNNGTFINSTTSSLGVKTVYDSLGRQAKAFDAQGRLVSVVNYDDKMGGTGQIESVINYGYDGAEEVTTTLYKNGSPVMSVKGDQSSDANRAKYLAIYDDIINGKLVSSPVDMKTDSQKAKDYANIISINIPANLIVGKSDEELANMLGWSLAKSTDKAGLKSQLDAIRKAVGTTGLLTMSLKGSADINYTDHALEQVDGVWGYYDKDKTWHPVDNKYITFSTDKDGNQKATLSKNQQSDHSYLMAQSIEVQRNGMKTESIVVSGNTKAYGVDDGKRTVTPPPVNHDPIVQGTIKGFTEIDGRQYVIVKAESVDVFDGQGAQTANGEEIYIDISELSDELAQQIMAGKEGTEIILAGDIVSTNGSQADGKITMKANGHEGAVGEQAINEWKTANVGSQWYNDAVKQMSDFFGGIINWLTGWTDLQADANKPK